MKYTANLLLFTLFFSACASAMAMHVQPDNTVDFRTDRGRILDLTADEPLTLQPFTELADGYKRIGVPLVIVRVNKGPHEQYYNLYAYTQRDTTQDNTDPLTREPITSEDFYMFKNNDQHNELVHLGQQSQSHPNTALKILLGNLQDTYKLIDTHRTQLAKQKVKLGASFLNQAKYAEALAHYQEALLFNNLDATTTAQVNSDIGTCLYYLGKEAEAIPYLTEALTSKKLTRELDARTQQLVAWCLVNLKKYTDALSFFKRALASGELSAAEINYGIGICLYRLHRHAEAVPHYQEALASSDTDSKTAAHAKKDLCFCLFVLNKHAEAVPYIREALASGIATPISIACMRMNLGYCLLQLNNPAEAESHLRAVLESGNLRPIYRASTKAVLSCCLFSLGLYEEAEYCLKGAHNFIPQEALTLHDTADHLELRKYIAEAEQLRALRGARRADRSTL